MKKEQLYFKRFNSPIRCRLTDRYRRELRYKGLGVGTAIAYTCLHADDWGWKIPQLKIRWDDEDELDTIAAGWIEWIGRPHANDRPLFDDITLAMYPPDLLFRDQLASRTETALANVFRWTAWRNWRSLYPSDVSPADLPVCPCMVAAKTEQELRCIPGIGPQTVKDIKQWLALFDLRLAH